MTVKTQAEIDAEFNKWFTASFDALMAPHTERLNRQLDLIQDVFDDIEKGFDDINKSFDAHAADIGNIGKAISSGEKDAEGKLILRKLDDALAKMRDELRAEMALKLRSLRTTIKRDMSTQVDAARASNITNLPAVIRKS
jgi:hypothetical protein